MVSGNDDQCVAPLLRKRLSDTNRIIKFNGVQNPALSVHIVCLLVDRSSLYHEYKSILIFRQHIQSFDGHLFQHRLVRKSKVVYYATFDAILLSSAAVNFV